MNEFPKKLLALLEKRQADHNFRELTFHHEKLADFCSNDYLGFARSAGLKKQKEKILRKYKVKREGATGARLLTGNSLIARDCEKQLARFHKGEKALLFNSGYDANTGLLSCAPLRGDLVIYDELCHASIIDGVRQSFADNFKFRHNDVEHLERLLERNRSYDTIYVVTESVFSMDGDCARLHEISSLCKKHHAFLIVDEAHATGVYGAKGRGLCNELHLEEDCFARVYTFGKALGTHGAAVVGNTQLIDYLVNFARSFIYTTALPPASIAGILAGYTMLNDPSQIKMLKKNIELFNNLTAGFVSKINSNSAIHCFLLPGNENVVWASGMLRKRGFDVRAIKSPTVKTGSERLRVCLHADNSESEIKRLATELAIIFS